MRSFLVALALLLPCAAAAQDETLIKGQDEGGFRRPIRTDTSGRLQGVQGQKLLDSCDATTGWTALSNDTTGIVVALDHVEGAKSLEFDKVDGAAGLIFGGVQKTLVPAVDIEQYMENSGFVLVSMNLSDLTDVAYCFVRLGTDASNYNEWRVDDDALGTGWLQVRFAFYAPDTAGNLGNGIDASAIAYVALGCAFDLETSALADIRVDNIAVNAGSQVSADVQSQVGAVVGAANVNVFEIASQSVQYEAVADALPSSKLGLYVNSRALLYNGANWDMWRAGATGGALSDIVDWPNAFNISAGSVDANIDDHTIVEPTKQGPTAVDNAGGGVVGDIVFTSRKILSDPSWCVSIKNTGGGSGDVLSDAILLVSDSGVAGDWESMPWTVCDALANSGFKCSYCSDVARAHIQVEALCGPTDDTEVEASYSARK